MTRFLKGLQRFVTRLYGFLNGFLNNHYWFFVPGGRSMVSPPMNAVPTSSSTTPASEIVLPHDPFTESTVTEIVSLGFTRAQVLAELRRLNGDKAQATAALFAKSLKFWVPIYFHIFIFSTSIQKGVYNNSKVVAPTIPTKNSKIQQIFFETALSLSPKLKNRN